MGFMTYHPLLEGEINWKMRGVASGGIKKTSIEERGRHLLGGGQKGNGNRRQQCSQALKWGLYRKKKRLQGRKTDEITRGRPKEKQKGRGKRGKINGRKMKHKAGDGVKRKERP